VIDTMIDPVISERDAMRWWRRAGVHLRSAIAATAVLAVLMCLASVVLVGLLQRSLISGIDSTGRARATGVAAQVRFTAAGGLDDPEGELRSEIDAEAARRSWVQVLDDRRRVIASSSDITAPSPLADLQPAPGQFLAVQRRFPFDDDEYRVSALGGRVDGRTFTVLVGQSLGPAEASRESVLALLAVGVPLLLIVLGATTYVFVRRSLRPVEAIRRTVASITNRDLSERVDVPPADDAVSRLARTMNEMLERLERAQQVQQQFVADASHELRSPVASLATTAEFHLPHPQPGDVRAFPTAVLEEARRLQRLVDDLLVLARVDERGSQPVTRRDVDLDDILDGERHRLTAISTLQVEARIRPTRTSGDPHQLEQMVRNLVDNAAQHARTRVELSVQPSGPDAVVEIFDDGPGIAVADRRRIFDRFVRLEESRDRRSGGTGLGLAIVQEIVTAHRGTVAVVDDPDGTRFRVTLPIA
jgi:signal transduction histidine kinase